MNHIIILIVTCLFLLLSWAESLAIKQRVDSYLTSLFRQCYYKTDKEAGRTVYKSDTAGFQGMMEEMNMLLHDHKDDSEYLYKSFQDAMDTFFRELGVPPDEYARFCQERPGMAAWINKVTANWTFGWVVGGAKITPYKGNVLQIERCYFRESIGEEGCVKLCQKPVEQYFRHRMNSPISLVPQPRDQGLGCRICYGAAEFPKNCAWREKS